MFNFFEISNILKSKAAQNAAFREIATLSAVLYLVLLGFVFVVVLPWMCYGILAL